MAWEDTGIRSATTSNHVSRTRLVDLDAARELLSKRYKPHDLQTVRGADPFDFIHVSAPVPIGTFNVLQYGAGVEITPEPFGDFFMLEMPLRGGAILEREGLKTARSSTERALFLPPNARFRSAWGPTTLQLMLQIRKDVVLERWQMLCGDATRQLPKIFPEIDLSTPEGWRVRKLLMLLSDEMKITATMVADSLAETPLAVATVDAALAYVRTHQTTLADDPESVLPAHLRNCVRYIHDNLTADLSVLALLKHCPVSERTLFKLFKTFLHDSPRAYVEAARLRQARRSLLSGAPVSVSAKAAGFTHMGRFSASYEKTYGEKPSVTRANSCPDPLTSSTP